VWSVTITFAVDDGFVDIEQPANLVGERVETTSVLPLREMTRQPPCSM
jgi:hypothetical protein